MRSLLYAVLLTAGLASYALAEDAKQPTSMPSEEDYTQAAASCILKVIMSGSEIELRPELLDSLLRTSGVYDSALRESGLYPVPKNYTCEVSLELDDTGFDRDTAGGIPVVHVGGVLSVTAEGDRPGLQEMTARLLAITCRNLERALRDLSREEEARLRAQVEAADKAAQEAASRLGTLQQLQQELMDTAGRFELSPMALRTELERIQGLVNQQ